MPHIQPQTLQGTTAKNCSRFSDVVKIVADVDAPAMAESAAGSVSFFALEEAFLGAAADAAVSIVAALSASSSSCSSSSFAASSSSANEVMRPASVGAVVSRKVGWVRIAYMCHRAARRTNVSVSLIHPGPYFRQTLANRRTSGVSVAETSTVVRRRALLVAARAWLI